MPAHETSFRLPRIRIMERLETPAGIVKPAFSVAPRRDAWTSAKEL